MYDEYRAYCESESLHRVLSAPDFGKIVKCIYPDVKARRLGTRGNSKYCYNGLRRKVVGEKQDTIDSNNNSNNSDTNNINDETKDNNNNNVNNDKKDDMGDIQVKIKVEEDCSEQTTLEQSLTAAASVVCEWANKLLGRVFTSLLELAKFLVSGSYVSTKSVASFLVMAAGDDVGERYSFDQLASPSVKKEFASPARPSHRNSPARPSHRNSPARPFNRNVSDGGSRNGSVGGGGGKEIAGKLGCDERLSGYSGIQSSEVNSTTTDVKTPALSTPGWTSLSSQVVPEVQCGEVPRIKSGVRRLGQQQQQQQRQQRQQRQQQEKNQQQQHLSQTQRVDSPNFVSRPVSSSPCKKSKDDGDCKRSSSIRPVQQTTSRITSSAGGFQFSDLTMSAKPADLTKSASDAVPKISPDDSQNNNNDDNKSSNSSKSRRRSRSHKKHSKHQRDASGSYGNSSTAHQQMSLQQQCNAMSSFQFSENQNISSASPDCLDDVQSFFYADSLMAPKCRSVPLINNNNDNNIGSLKTEPLTPQHFRHNEEYFPGEGLQQKHHSYKAKRNLVGLFDATLGNNNNNNNSNNNNNNNNNNVSSLQNVPNVMPLHSKPHAERVVPQDMIQNIPTFATSSVAHQDHVDDLDDDFSGIVSNVDHMDGHELLKTFQPSNGNWMNDWSSITMPVMNFT